MSSDLKICSRCGHSKSSEKDFYTCKGKQRSECKACTIRKNVAYQKQMKSWKHRFVDIEGKRTYMAEYYATHKEQFAAYKRKFKEKYPDYDKEYARKRKNER